MSIWSALTEKPWEPAGAPAATARASGPGTRLAAQKLALNFFLVVISAAFLLFLVTYITHSQYQGFQPLAGEPWMPLSDASQLWFNTSLLVISSVAIHYALICSRRGNRDHTLIAILVAGFFAVQFVLAQLWLWREMTGLGYTFATNPANSYFYLLTAAHGLHLIGGLVVLFGVLALIWQDAAPERIQSGLALTTRYWHYLLGLWLVLFAMLASPPEIYDAIAAACGLDGS